VQGRKTYAGTANSDAYHHYAGKECLDVHLLKLAGLDDLPEQPDVVCADDGQLAGHRHSVPRCPASWRGTATRCPILKLEYPFRNSHSIQVIRWLPTKLAAWIGENFGQELQIPPKRDLEWPAGELNAILEPATGAKGSFRHSVAFSGSVNSTVEGPRHDATRSI
jgi:hypothetical protein